MQGETLSNPKGMNLLARELNKQLVQVDAVDGRVDMLEARLGHQPELRDTELFAAGLMYSAMVDILGDIPRAERGIARLPMQQREYIQAMIDTYRGPINGGLYELAPSGSYVAGGTVQEHGLALLIPKKNLKLAGIDYLRQLVDDKLIKALSPRYHAIGLMTLARIGLLSPRHPTVIGDKKRELVQKGFAKRMLVNGLWASLWQE